MEEKTYAFDKEFPDNISTIGCIIIIGITVIIVGASVIIGLIFIFDITNIPTFSYVNIIRRNNGTEFDFYGMKRTICLSPYFSKFPMKVPDIGYEYVDDLSPNFDPLYTLQKIKQDLDITVHWQDSLTNGGIKYDFNNKRIVVVAWDYNNIPELAQSLGCEQCKSWSIDPTSNITDDSLFDITWVLRYGKYDKHGIFIKKHDVFEFYTILQNLQDSIVTLQSPLKEGMSMAEILNSYDCNYVSNYDIKKIEIKND